MISRKKFRVELYSSVAGDAFWSGFVDALTAAGYRTEIVSAVAPESYRGAKGRWARLWLRWRLTGGFAIKAAARICGQRLARRDPVVRIVTTNPFFLPAWVQLWSARRDRTVFLLFDLYPEALVSAGWTRPDSMLARVAAGVTRRAITHCAATVFLGREIERYVAAAHAQPKISAVIPVGALGREFADRPPQPLDTHAPVELLYAGVMGRMHDVETLQGLLTDPLPGGIAIRIHATGRGVEQLKKARGSERIAFGGALDGPDWKSAMQRASVGLITLSRGSGCVAMPSKTYSALVAGQAILAICERQSDLAELVRAHDCGWVIEPGDVDGLRRVLGEIARDRAELHAKRCRAFAAGHRHFDMSPVAAQWLALIDVLN